MALELIIGPMYAGKTTKLMERVKFYRNYKLKCLVLNHTSDNRYKNKDYISTHDNIHMKAVSTKDLIMVNLDLQTTLELKQNYFQLIATLI